MSEQENRATLERFFEAFSRQDPDAMIDLLHDDHVEEYPQSGERIRGKQNWLAIVESYPSLPNLIDHSFKLSGDLAVTEMTLEYDSNRIYGCEILELQDGKIKRTRAYFGAPFEAPEWRAQWIERME